ncbi:MAG: MOSC domain-containing protein [Sphingomonadales bacterium]|nr:MAG: MOSC domain-containing protein [Sphingomonadales bacterium]
MQEIIGTVAALNRFPVKSMAAEPLQVAEIDWQGMEGDRQYAFYFRESRSRFPWLTGRDVSGLVLHSARFADPDAPKTSRVEIVAPDGWRGDVNDPELLARLSAAAGAPVGLMQLAIGAYDSMPVSVVTTAAHHRVETAHGSALDMRRFRANVVIESDHSQTEWAGKRIAFGDANPEGGGAELLMTDGIPRCAMVTIDPDNAARDPGVLRTIARQFGNAYGAYAAPAKKGLVRVGDVVRVSG